MNEAYFNNAYSLFLPATQVNQSASYFSLPDEAVQQPAEEQSEMQEAAGQTESPEVPTITLNRVRSSNTGGGGY